MSVSTPLNRVDYGVTAATTFAVPFPFTENSHLVVIRTDSAGTLSTLILDTDYTVTGAGGASGSIVYAAHSATDLGLSIKRVVPLTQTVVLPNQGAFFPATHEAEFDKLTMIDQQQQEQLDRAATLPEGMSGSIGTPVEGTVLGWLNGVWTWVAAASAGLQQLLAATGTGQGAALVGYLAPFTGAVARTQQSKNNDIIHVSDFGAIGDGSDETTKLQAALNAAAGRVLRFGDNTTYKAYALKVSVGTTLDLGTATIKKRPALVGDQTVGQFTGNTSIWWSTDPIIKAPLLYITGDNVVIKGGTLDGDRTAETYGLAQWGGSFAVEGNRCLILASHSAIPDVKSLTVNGVNFKNAYGDCVVTEYLTGTTRIQNCTETNSGSIFAYCLNEANPPVYDGKAGDIFLTDNKLQGVRASNAVSNPFVIAGYKNAVITGNIVDGTAQTASGGCKIQSCDDVGITGNTFKNEYIKPQAATSFTGNTLNISSNTFSSTAPLTHVAGIQMGIYRARTLTVSANSITNGNITIERSCDVINVTGNTLKMTMANVDSGNFFAIYGGANVSGVASKETVRGNTVDMGGFDKHAFYYGAPPANGDVVISENDASGCDSIFFFNNPESGVRLEFSRNSFQGYRAIGRIGAADYKSITFKGNAFKNQSTTTASNMAGTTSRTLYMSLGGTTISTIAIEDNLMDAVENYASGDAGWLKLDPGTLTSLFINRNTINCGNSGGYGCTCQGGTITNLVMTGNFFNLPLLFTPTITNSVVTDNTFPEAISNGIQGSGLTKRPVTFTGDTGTTVGAAGGASALPATPTGYLAITVDGTARKVPFYA